ncbi:MAG: cyclic nucleotide-binding domain-containing protein [Thermodesulfobacteriota bacterium]
MYFQQSDLFEGLDEGFVKEFMDIGEKETHKTGHIVFHEGDPASHFFLLIRGRVKIAIGDTGHTVYTVDRPGEVFGWSSLVGRAAYTASAECRDQTVLMRIDVGRLNRLLEKSPATGLVLFKRLAGSLGNRLLQTYRMISDTPEGDVSRSYGTGQVLASEGRVS